jgi:hypothetical protein
MTSSGSEDTLPPLSGQFYSLVYGNNPEQRQLFFTTKKPASVAALLKNKHVLSLLQNNEPGPNVDYEVLRLNLSQLQQHLSTSFGRYLLDFFRYLLQVRAKWMISAVKFETFNAYSIMLYQYYVVERREAQNQCAYGTLAYLAYEHECITFQSSNAPAKIENYFRALRDVYTSACRDLVDAKLSDQMWKCATVLWKLVEQYDEDLSLRKEAGRVKQEAERIEKELATKARQRGELKAHNAMMQTRQLGMHMVVNMDEGMSQNLLGWMKEQLDG